MPYDIIAIDIDGTLLTSDRNISERTLRAVRDAELAGKNLVLCTGRSFNSGRATAEKLPASTTLVFHANLCIPIPAFLKQDILNLFLNYAFQL